MLKFNIKVSADNIQQTHAPLLFHDILELIYVLLNKPTQANYCDSIHNREHHCCSAVMRMY